jgi:hypothetical protein
VPLGEAPPQIAGPVHHFIELRGKETDHLREFPEMLQVRDFSRCPVEQLMLYAVRPGTTLHPHRDMSGNLPFGRLRFHFPIVTHPEFEFVVGGKRVDMRSGELWALDTSYERSVRNRSNQVRVHLVVEVVANDWVWSLLPKKGVAYYGHLAGFWTLACWVGARKLRADRRFLARNFARSRVACATASPDDGDPRRSCAARRDRSRCGRPAPERAPPGGGEKKRTRSGTKRAPRRS